MNLVLFNLLNLKKLKAKRSNNRIVIFLNYYFLYKGLQKIVNLT